MVGRGVLGYMWLLVCARPPGILGEGVGDPLSVKEKLVGTDQRLCSFVFMRWLDDVLYFADCFVYRWI